MADGRNVTGGKETGVMLPLVALALVFVMIGTLLLAAVVDAVVDRARAQAAADAAALAGAVDGEAAARRFAVANGAELVAFSRRSGGVEVTVRIDRARATAAAAVELIRD